MVIQKLWTNKALIDHTYIECRPTWSLCRTGYQFIPTLLTAPPHHFSRLHRDSKKESERKEEQRKRNKIQFKLIEINKFKHISNILRGIEQATAHQAKYSDRASGGAYARTEGALLGVE